MWRDARQTVAGQLQYDPGAAASPVHHWRIPHPAGDLRRMFANARVYNAPESIFFKISEKLEASFNKMLATMLVLDDE